MPTPSNIALGDIVAIGLPDQFCFTDARDLVLQLTNILKSSTPVSGITNLVVSNIQPSDSQTTSLWLRLSNSGSVIGFYVFSGGLWIPFMPPNDSNNTAVYWTISQNGDTPSGYAKIDGSTPGIPAAVLAAIQAQYVQDPTNTFDQYFAIYWQGT